MGDEAPHKSLDIRTINGKDLFGCFDIVSHAVTCSAIRVSSDLHTVPCGEAR